MLHSYRLSAPNERAKALAEKIVALVTSSAVTYRECEDALEHTQKLIEETTKPVIDPSLRTSDSEQ